MAARTPRTVAELLHERRGLVLDNEKPAIAEMLAQYGVAVEWVRFDFNDPERGWYPSPDKPKGEKTP